MTPMPFTIATCAAALQSGATTSEALVEAALAAAEDASGEGARVFIHLDRAGAIAQARACDASRAKGDIQGALAGLPVSVKDLFDIEGEVTRAGSVILRDAPPALHDAAAIVRLRQAGAVLVGRTNMVEFAYSGIGLNPHYGTPANPWGRAVGRVPGGSSSGAVISVTDRMAIAAVGTDTGGSVRIPAALCGVTGFKPSASRVDTTGALPLSLSMDSIGPIAQTVDCCARLDAVLAGDGAPRDTARSPKRLAVARNLVLEGLDSSVAAAFADALTKLSASGVELVDTVFPEFDEIAALNERLTLSAVEAYAWHRALLSRNEAAYDPRVARRILKGANVSAADYLDLRAQRVSLVASFAKRMRSMDALVMPTVPIIAPTIQSLVDSDALYASVNAQLLRNTSLINFLDGCALSIPCHARGTAPVGFAIASCNGRDADVLAIGRALEVLLAPA